MERVVYDAKPKWRAGVIIGIVVLAVILLFNSFVTIESGSVGVVYRFGAIKGYMTEGLKFLLPFIDNVRIMSIKTQKIDFQTDSFTRSSQEIKLFIVVNYGIRPDKAPYILGTIGDISYLESAILVPKINTIVKSIISQYPTDQIPLNREKIEKDTKEKLNSVVGIETKIIDGKEEKVETGIEIKSLSLENIVFSKQYTEAIEAKQVAEQKVQEAEFNRQKALKDKEIAQIQGEAEKVKQQSIGVSLTPLIIQSKWIEKWDGKTPTVVGSEGLIIDPFKKP